MSFVHSVPLRAPLSRGASPMSRRCRSALPFYLDYLITVEET